MQTLDKSLRGVLDTIPVPWPALAERITPGPGHLVTVVGATGVGKSAFGLAWALKIDRPTLILSLDSDLATQAARTVSSLSGIAFDEVRQNIPVWEEYLKTRMRQLPMMVDYPVQIEEVGEVVQAFEEFYGEKPVLVVLDNLKDVVKTKTYEGYDEAIRELHRLARKHRTTFVVLHHINRQRKIGRGDVRPEKDDALFAGEQDSEYLLALWREWDPVVGHALMVGVNKNRFGPDGMAVPLRFDMTRMIVG